MEKHIYDLERNENSTLYQVEKQMNTTKGKSKYARIASLSMSVCSIMFHLIKGIVYKLISDL